MQGALDLIQDLHAYRVPYARSTCSHPNHTPQGQDPSATKQNILCAQTAGSSSSNTDLLLTGAQSPTHKEGTPCPTERLRNHMLHSPQLEGAEWGTRNVAAPRRSRATLSLPTCRLHTQHPMAFTSMACSGPLPSDPPSCCPHGQTQ